MGLNAEKFVVMRSLLPLMPTYSFWKMCGQKYHHVPPKTSITWTKLVFFVSVNSAEILLKNSVELYV